MSQMQSLIQFSFTNPGLTPREAMSALVNSISNQQGSAQGQMPGMSNAMMQQVAQAQAQNQRTPNMDGGSQFASPALARLGLPGQQGSPHIKHSPSPAMSSMPGPAKMSAQLSQQGGTPNSGPGLVGAGTPGSMNKPLPGTVGNKTVGQGIGANKAMGQGIGALKPGGGINVGGSPAGTGITTSPNVKNKRRRSTAKVEVKAEGDEAGVDGATKVKQSPRVGGKRQKPSAP